MSMGGKGGGQIFNPNSQQQQGGFYGQPGLMGFPDQDYQQPMQSMQPMQPMQSSQPPPGYGAPGLGGIVMTPEIMAADAQRRQERGLPPNISSYQQNYGGGYGPVGTPGFPAFRPPPNPANAMFNTQEAYQTAQNNWNAYQQLPASQRQQMEMQAANRQVAFQQNYGGGYGPVSQFGGRGVSPQMQNWAASNPNSPFLPNDAPNPFYNGPPVSQFGGRGGRGGPGTPQVNVQPSDEIRTMPVTPIPQPQPMPQVRPQVQAPQVQAPQVQAPQPNFVPFVGADSGPVQVARAPEPPRVVRRRRGR